MSRFRDVIYIKSRLFAQQLHAEFRLRDLDLQSDNVSSQSQNHAQKEDTMGSRGPLEIEQEGNSMRSAQVRAPLARIPGDGDNLDRLFGDTGFDLKSHNLLIGEEGSQLRHEAESWRQDTLRTIQELQDENKELRSLATAAPDIDSKSNRPGRKLKGDSIFATMSTENEILRAQLVDAQTQSANAEHEVATMRLQAEAANLRIASLSRELTKCKNDLEFHKNDARKNQAARIKAEQDKDDCRRELATHKDHMDVLVAEVARLHQIGS